MRYLCLICVDEKKLAALPEGELQALVDSLRRSGHYVASNALQPIGTATTVRVRNGKTLVTDGPFAETKEQLGGFILIEAADLDDAIRVASGHPAACLGSIEMRPVREMKHS
jgi:hypothetical protein